MSKRKCPHCGKTVTGHPNKKFCRTKCKDRYHNRRNPRGRFAHLADQGPETDYRSYDDDIHPFDPTALGQE